MNIPHLRSPYETVSGMVYFGRMLDKIRLHAHGQLPPDYQENLGKAFDARCCQFLRIGYPELRAKVLQETSLRDEEFLAWSQVQGRSLDEGDLEIWNEFMQKRGWRDEARERLVFRLQEAGVTDDGTIQTFFDYIDFDEGRPLRAH